ncbi:unnamed protein product [Heligmosomoides polygyrus]|uniref:DUF1534 domain-containing protein n=1 Tax=Heligmosomoides polygyrus TaxID=6339 RepID=A0A183FHW1_HELPZ|nr:unnamed protein product [Heligmosomoides polygyrus]
MLPQLRLRRFAAPRPHSVTGDSELIGRQAGAHNRRDAAAERTAVKISQPALLCNNGTIANAGSRSSAGEAPVPWQNSAREFRIL